MIKTVARVCKINQNNCQLTIRKVEDGTTYSSYQEILTKNLGIRQIVANFCLRFLTDEKKTRNFLKVKTNLDIDHNRRENLNL